MILPEGVTTELPSQTEIVLKSMEKQKLGQVAAEIRGFRPPEPYKGKGVKYADEHISEEESKGLVMTNKSIQKEGKENARRGRSKS